MGKVGNLIGKKRGWPWLILAAGILGAPCLSSCGHEDADDLEKVAHRPGNDSDGGNSGAQTGGDNAGGGSQTGGDNGGSQTGGDNGGQGGGSDNGGSQTGGDNGAQGVGSDNGGSQTGGDENGENGGGEVMEVSPIVGRWMVVGTEEIHVFEADGRYTSPLLLVGSYTYDDLHRWLYLSIDDGVEVYVKEYKCILDGEKMTWYDLTGRKTELRKDGD